MLHIFYTGLPEPRKYQRPMLNVSYLTNSYWYWWWHLYQAV